MNIAVKYIILLFAFIAGSEVIESKNIALAVICVGAFIAYALIEVQDLKTINAPEENE